MNEWHPEAYSYGVQGLRERVMNWKGVPKLSNLYI